MQTNIRSEIFCDTSHDITSPSDVSYDVGRVSANHRRALKRHKQAANHIHRRQHPSTKRRKKRWRYCHLCSLRARAISRVSAYSSLIFIHLYCVLWFLLCIVGLKRTLSDKDAPAKKRARKSVSLEQKADILWLYDSGESTAAIRNALLIPESSLGTIRKDREKMTLLLGGINNLLNYRYWSTLDFLHFKLLFWANNEHTS